MGSKAGKHEACTASKKMSTPVAMTLDLRLPDPLAFPITKDLIAVDHDEGCFALPKTEDASYTLDRVACLARRAQMPGNFLAALNALTLSLYNAGNTTMNFRCHLVEHVPDSHLSIRVKVYWSEAIADDMRPLVALASLPGAKFVVTPQRFGRELTAQQLRNMTLSSRDPTGLLTDTAADHLPAVPIVEAFIQNGDREAFIEAMSALNPAVAPSIRSVQRVIDISGRFSVQLKPYQIATVAWALDREQPDCNVHHALDVELGEERLCFGHYPKVSMTKTPIPTGPRGGMILEEMGMGKTIETLALLFASENDPTIELPEENEASVSSNNARDRVDLGFDEDEAEVVVIEEPEKAKTTEKPPAMKTFNYTLPYVKQGSYVGGTLVIAPLSLANQWADEVRLRVKNGEDILRPVLYHGGCRHKYVTELANTPLVITTYETVTADARLARKSEKIEKALLATTWKCKQVPYMVRYKTAPRYASKGDVMSGGVSYGNTDNWYVVDSLDYRGRIGRVKQIIPPPDGALFPRIPGHSYSTKLYDARIEGRLKYCNREHASAAQEVCEVCRNAKKDALVAFLKDEVLTAPLEQVRWHRIVLDESQKIQSAKTALFAAVDRIKAERRWCLTGTPMPKSPSNLFGQLKFLGIRDAVAGLFRGAKAFADQPCLVPLLSHLMIRHEKASCLKDSEGLSSLPEVTSRDELIELNEDDMTEYRRLARSTRTHFASLGDDAASRTTDLLHRISRERNVCTLLPTCDLALFKPKRQKTAGGTAKVKRPGPLPRIPENALNADEECPVCLEAIPHAVVLPCRHSFCHECLPTLLESGHQSCVVCQRRMMTKDVADVMEICRAVERGFEQRRLYNLAQAAKAQAGDKTGVKAPKIEAMGIDQLTVRARSKYDRLIEILEEQKAPALIFTQFDVAIETLRLLLTNDGFGVHVLTGSMSRQARTKSVTAFNSSKQDVLILSLRAASFGLNLVHAALVVFLEPALNRGMELQAIGRVHRLGQTRPVSVVHLIARGTVEERIREFRDLDTSDETAGATKIGGVTVIKSDLQRRMWRQQQLTNLLKMVV